MNPRALKNYAEQMYEFVKNEEGIRPYVYPCSQHVPTIGVGYALAEKSAGGFGPRAGLDDDLAKIGVSMTAGDKNRLSKVCNMLNDGSINQAIIGNKFKDPFDLTLTNEQAKQLFTLCIPKYDAVLRQKLGFKLYKELQNSREMVTLFSLAYNAPGLIGKNLVNALKVGNRARVQYEIRYGSNKKRDIGLDSRRKREAREFGQYDGETATAEELRAEEEIKKTYAMQIAKYDNEMGARRKPKTAKRASGPKTALNKGRKQLQPGAAPNQKEVWKRIHEVKAHPHHNSIFERIRDMFGSPDKAIHRDWSHPHAGLDVTHYHKRWS